MKQSQRSQNLSRLLGILLPRHRMSRSLFWVVMLVAVLGFFAFFSLLEAVFGAGTSLTWLLYPVFYWVAIVACLRRYRDLNKSGWSLLLLLIPLLGPMVVSLELGFRKGTAGDNRYGADPTRKPDYMTVA